MKTRAGFVSNSSSASFVLLKGRMTELQCAVVRNYDKILRALMGKDFTIWDSWVFEEDEAHFCFHTSMDNCHLARNFKILGISSSAITDEHHDG